MEMPRLLALVKLRSDIDGEGFPFGEDQPLVFLGEIPNMPEHGIFVGFHSGRVYPGFHIWNFEELTEDEV